MYWLYAFKFAVRIHEWLSLFDVGILLPLHEIFSFFFFLVIFYFKSFNNKTTYFGNLNIPESCCWFHCRNAAASHRRNPIASRTHPKCHDSAGVFWDWLCPGKFYYNLAGHTCIAYRPNVFACVFLSGGLQWMLGHSLLPRIWKP